jgi:hypothetical protein
MAMGIRGAVAVAAALLWMPGCSTDEDPGPGSDPGWGVLELFPLDIGSHWTYVDVAEDGTTEVLEKLLTHCASLEFTDCA